ncbi:hypothetical protein [Prevotella sp. P4-67]|nr:hypothetical protein [Prevotella sp. P4-67]
MFLLIMCIDDRCARARACLSCPAAAAVVIICDGLGWRRGHG